MEEYFDLPGTVSVLPADLVFPRARKLLTAVDNDKDCKFIECRRSIDGLREIIIIDLETHDIPTRSRVDIRFPERLALVVHNTARRFVAALMLRKNFPTLLHQNQTAPGTPRDLCLYFEPTPVVMRTWTAPRFIRRIKWWLASSSAGTLHAADQLPEMLFFNSDFELVVPSNFDELVSDGKKFGLAISEKHLGGGCTYILSEISGQVPGAPEPISIFLPPVVHGYIEDSPDTLGDLVQVLSPRGVDLIESLREKFKSRLAGETAAANFGGIYTLLVLHTPIKASPEAPPSRLTHHVFMIFVPFLEVGRKIGAYALHEGRYFCETNLAGQVAQAEGLETMDMAQFALLYKNSVEDFRSQSGSADGGVTSVLIGAGALGSSLLNLWVRSGWGSWTVIDKDHIKPHNLTRHVATDRQIGRGKAAIVAEAAIEVTGDPTRFKAVQADATIAGNDQVAGALRAASLVVDASTTLEYPRQACDDLTLPRHMSLFLTPSGRSSVLLCESADRSINMRTTEAQYYRAIISEPWGQDHLSGNLGTFWSGASCRDISLRLPLAQVQLHAANLAQMVVEASKSEASRISIWRRESSSGEMTAYSTSAFAETQYECGSYTIFLDEGLEAELRAMRGERLPNETGGILLGYHDLVRKHIVVVKACTAPPDSVGTPTSFVRGTLGVAKLLKDVEKRTAAIVGYMGDWHSHPIGHSARASQDDVVQLVGLARTMVEDGLPALQIIVGEDEINVYLAESV